MDYLMENEEEVLRLDLKTDNRVTEQQACWAGIKPGMRVADIGCGSGKTTNKLFDLVQPGGCALGIDIAEQRISFAKKNYKKPGLEFLCRDAREPMDDLGQFDFVWVRFLLEYYKSSSFLLLQNIIKLVRPGGIICVIDLDYNCLTQYGLSPKLENTINNLMFTLMEKADFDPFAGRKLYSYLFDLRLNNINIDVSSHHIIYGKIDNSDLFNWRKKLEIAPKKVGYDFGEFKGGFEEFKTEIESFLENPRRFIYTPIILAKANILK